MTSHQHHARGTALTYSEALSTPTQHVPAVATGRTYDDTSGATWAELQTETRRLWATIDHPHTTREGRPVVTVDALADVPGEIVLDRITVDQLRPGQWFRTPAKLSGHSYVTQCAQAGAPGVGGHFGVVVVDVKRIASTTFLYAAADTVVDVLDHGPRWGSRSARTVQRFAERAAERGNR